MESKAKLLGHPIHAMLIVFPLGVLGMSVIFDVVTLVIHQEGWPVAAPRAGPSATPSIEPLINYMRSMTASITSSRSSTSTTGLRSTVSGFSGLRATRKVASG